MTDTFGSSLETPTLHLTRFPSIVRWTPLETVFFPREIHYCIALRVSSGSGACS